MRQFILVVLLFFSLLNEYYSQNQCNCVGYKKQFSELENNLELKQFNEFSTDIIKIKSVNLLCQQQKWALYNEYYILKNELNSADSICKLFKSTLTSKSCVLSVALYHYQKGNLFFKRNTYDSAAINLLRAINLTIELKDTLMQLKATSQLARNFIRIKQSNKAYEYQISGLKLLNTFSNKKMLLSYYTHLNSTFGVWFDDTEGDAANKYLDSIKDRMPFTLKLAKELNNKDRIAQCYSILAGVFFSEQKYSFALKYCDSSLLFVDIKTDFNRLSAIYQKKADNYIALKNYTQAIKYSNLYLGIIKKSSDMLLIADSYERLYECYKYTNNSKLSLLYHEKMVKIRDSLRTQEITETVNELEQKHNKSQNEKQIKELSQQQEIDNLRIRSLIALSTVAALLALVIFFVYRQKSIKGKLKTIETEQRLNRARMNPHFFFNALASLQNLSLSDSKKDLVPGFISKFSKIMRQSLESTFNELDTIENEISFLTDYLELQKLRSENRFNYEFELDDSIETSEMLIPGMILQPFIENSIEHGFKNSTHEGLITISFIVKDKLLQIAIIDNGQGIKDNEKHKTYPSRATQIIKDRLFLLNKTYKSNANFVLTTVENNKGIKVEINLPIIYKT